MPRRRLFDDKMKSLSVMVPQRLYVRIVDEAARRMAASHDPVTPSQVVRSILDEHLPNPNKEV